MDEPAVTTSASFPSSVRSPTGVEPVRQQMLYDANRKSAGVAYLLAIFLGGFGAHRFYLGEKGTAITQLILTIVGWLTVIIVVGLFLLAAVGIWLIVDLFLIPGIVRDKNMRLADSITGS